VRGAEYAAVCVVRPDGQVETPAVTGESGLEADRVQAALEVGPCVSAATEGVSVVVDDVAEERRWPAFSFRAMELGVRSMVTCALRLGSDAQGALVVISRKPRAFDAQALDVAEIYATHASAALANSRTVDSLRAAVRSRQVIGEATGILMERHRIDASGAFDLLVRASQDLNVKLKLIAERVVHTGQEPRNLRWPDLPSNGH
jgi:GAF domain-containing protein